MRAIRVAAAPLAAAHRAVIVLLALLAALRLSALAERCAKPRVRPPQGLARVEEDAVLGRRLARRLLIVLVAAHRRLRLAEDGEEHGE